MHYPDYVFLGADLTDEVATQLAALDQQVGQARVDAGKPAINIALVPEGDALHPLATQPAYGATAGNEQATFVIAVETKRAVSPVIDLLRAEIRRGTAALEGALSREMQVLYDRQDSHGVHQHEIDYDNGIGRTMSALQACEERLLEAKAHIDQINNLISRHPDLTPPTGRALPADPSVPAVPADPADLV